MKRIEQQNQQLAWTKKKGSRQSYSTSQKPSLTFWSTSSLWAASMSGAMKRSFIQGLQRDIGQTLTTTASSCSPGRQPLGKVFIWSYFTTERTRSYTFSNGVVVLRGRRNSMPWQAASSSIARTREPEQRKGCLAGTAQGEVSCVKLSLAFVLTNMIWFQATWKTSGSTRPREPAQWQDHFMDDAGGSIKHFSKQILGALLYRPFKCTRKSWSPES